MDRRTFIALLGVAPTTNNQRTPDEDLKPATKAHAAAQTVVSVTADGKHFAGLLGEKIAGGLFEITNTAGSFVGVFRMDQIRFPGTAKGTGESR